MKRAHEEELACFTQAEALDLWAALTRAVPATPEALLRWPAHAATVKLDGRRVALVRRGGRLWRVTQQGAARLADADPGPDFVADAEELEGTFHVFDALLADGQDVRALALPQRLAALAPLLPQEMTRLKSYRPLRAAADLAQALALSRASPAADGLVLVSLDAPYERPPLKFKERVTCDLTLESSGPGRFRVLARAHRRLQPLRWPLPPTLLLDPGELARGGLPAAELRRGDGVVVECELRDGRWQLLRRRPDRQHPNDMQTVASNVALAAAGMHTARWLLGAVPAVDGPEAVRCWLAALRRELTVAALLLEPDREVVELAQPEGYEDLYQGRRWRAAEAATAVATGPAGDGGLWLAVCCLTSATVRPVLRANWRRLLLAVWPLQPATARRLALPELWAGSRAELQEIIESFAGAAEPKPAVRELTPPLLPELLRLAPVLASLQAGVHVYMLSR